MLLLMLSVAVVLVTAGQIAALLSKGQPMADLHNSGERERERKRECQKKRLNGSAVLSELKSFGFQ